jgi:hypothetical protein
MIQHLTPLQIYKRKQKLKELKKLLIIIPMNSREEQYNDRILKRIKLYRERYLW